MDQENSRNHPDLLIATLQCFLFFLLWAVWALPGTIVIRNACLVVGAGLSIYQLLSNWPQVNWIKARPSILCIALFFTWVLSRLFFYPNDPSLQWYELQSVWKRSILALTFGSGLTFALAKYSEKKYLYKIIFFGLCCPLFIYYLKFICTFWLPGLVIVPDWLILYYGAAPFYVPKIAYVFFCIPLFAVLLAEVLYGSKEKRGSTNYLNIVLMVAISVLFLIERIKNGILYEVILILLGLILLFRMQIMKRKLSWKLFILFAFALIITGLTVQQNASWRQFYADYKVASDVDKYQSWNGTEPLPLNENGLEVSGTNYDRISWAIVGSRLLWESPLGYGLIERSFGHLAERHWPGSGLSQTHSGLLDLTLGIGIPGTILILFAFVFAFRGALSPHPALGRYLFWMVTSIGLLFLTTEVSQRIYIETLFLMLGGSLGLTMANWRDQSAAKLE